MILLLAQQYNRTIAFTLLIIMMAGLTPTYGATLKERILGKPMGDAINHRYYHAGSRMKPLSTAFSTPSPLYNEDIATPAPAKGSHVKAATTNVEIMDAGVPFSRKKTDKTFIGGPSQPEMSSFRSAGVENMVNLFTGDFSYNIPLLDVGGYPVNIFYDGSVGMDQDASWCGLGWNINPGNVNRNMRGVPDDFNGEEKLIQTQAMKPNKTWGVNLSGDLEFVGIKQLPKWLSLSAGVNLGVSFNNYLGPALEFGLKGGANFQVASKARSEKSADSANLKVGISLAANASSRYGLTLSPNVSLTASHFGKSRDITNGLSLGTSYNSRNGIKALQISDQTTFNGHLAKNKYINGLINRGISNASRLSSSITFTKPSYIPTIRMPITNEALSGRFQLGGAIWGIYGSVEAEVFGQTATVEGNDRVQNKPMVGYIYYQKAQNNPQAVMDFTRFNDNEVTPTTPIISAPQYSYDVFSIQGEGTGGSIRAYRNDHGYVRDNTTRSRDRSLGLGADVGIPGHFGANVNTIKTPSTIGEWGDGNQLRNTLVFKEANGAWENVYFRNPGEVSVLHEEQFNRIGGTDLVRFKLGGTNSNPTVTPELERFSAAKKLLASVNMATVTEPLERKKRTQVVSFLTAAEADVIGLDRKIKNYDRYNLLTSANQLNFQPLDRVNATHKAHHISQINVMEADGKRYVYGIPVYNLLQKDFSFSVEKETIEDVVNFDNGDAGLGSQRLQTSSKVDGFLQISETPAYSHSFLLSGLLSPDYVDVNGDGITEDDLGTAVKFNYTQTGTYKWRTPLAATANMANFHEGNYTEKKDNKGIIAYGERESWYLHSLESKTMIAFFILGQRKDSKGADGEFAGINTGDTVLRRLERIDLYSKADLKKNGLSGARPIKSVHFQYSYALCSNAPGNNGAAEVPAGQSTDVNAAKGKLTLEKIYFTFNGQTKSTNKSQYVFSYGSGNDNPAYEFNGSDRWGNYKPKADNPDLLKNAQYPYTIQKEDATSVLKRKQQAGAWALKKVLLPSGGQIEVDYESDDYGFVQDRRAATMMEIAGLGRDNVSGMSNKLYEMFWPTGAPSPTQSLGIQENDKVYIKVPVACSTKAEVLERYLKTSANGSINQLAFKLAVNMPKGIEYVSSYATIADYGFVSGEATIWVKLNTIEGVTPLTLTAIEYLREQLPGQAYPGYDVSESGGLKQMGEMLAGMLDGIKSAFRDPMKYLRSQGLVQSIVLSRSFVRLSDPDGRKYGGGHRVSKVVMKDNWDRMTQQFGAQYGQTYEYSTTEMFNGAPRTISSGVASYEPSIGGEENPFQTIVQVASSLPMGPTSYGAVEMPVLDAFFPAPVVGYSKVTVRSLNKSKNGKKSRSGVGKQVTEFYTAKDYPVYYNHTDIDPASDKQKHIASLNLFFYKYAFDSRALSQGFLVATNDMHGKMKSQSSYAENDTTTRINYTENFYRNTGSKGLNEQFDFAYGSEGGTIKPGVMGVDIELMTDTREFSIGSSSWEIQAQVDLFPVIFPFWLPFIWPVRGESENTYRAVTTTKVISYHSILDSVVVIDKGSQVSTKNLVYDAETGDVLVNRTNNEFDKPVYNTTYPAYWAYSGMGPAYKNINASFSGINFYDGKITNSNFDQGIIESGDELYITQQPSGSAGCIGAVAGDTLLWAFDKNKNTTALTVPVKDLIFLDKSGRVFTGNNVAFKIVRSGKRNQAGASVASITLMTNPVSSIAPRKLQITSTSKVINASAMEFREKWQTDPGVIRRMALVSLNACNQTEVEDCNGYLEKTINPYCKGLVGNFRSYRSLIYYGNRTETSPAVATNLPENGFLADFAPYWNFSGNNLVPDIVNIKWTWNSQITRINAKGQETETKDALNIYTAAQYGYNQSMPVAITNNSRSFEMFHEGFEDYQYNENLNNNSQSTCTQNKLIDFTKALQSGFASIINTSTSDTVQAHSGKYVLRVNAGKTVVKDSIPLANPYTNEFPLAMSTDVTKVLNDIGGTVTNVDMHPWVPNVDVGNGQYNTAQEMVNSKTQFKNGGWEISSLIIRDAYSDNNETRSHWFKIQHDHYINVKQDGTYWFQLNMPPWGTNGLQSLSIQCLILDENDNWISNFYSFNNETPTTNIYLCKGRYKIVSYVYNRVILTHDHNYQPDDWSGGSIPYLGTILYPCVSAIYSAFVVLSSPGFTCFDNNNNSWGYGPITLKTNASDTSFRSLSSVNGCTYTKPISGLGDMINPVFMPDKNKKMLFSAWVKETCGNPASGQPCKASTYDQSSIKLNFNYNYSTIQSVTFKPAGPIIDGWQRIEGTFEAPANAVYMDMQFINASGTPVYFDDIRIHPFDANMKSYVYDPVNLRLTAELDANNYTTFYEYDEEGGLIRTKAETKEGIKTIQETRSFKQKTITTTEP